MELVGICPWCGQDRLYYNPEKNVYVCFKVYCGRSGRGKPPVTEWLGVRESKQKPDVLTLPEDAQPLPAQPHSLITKRISHYLQSHHVSWSLARRMGLMYSPRTLLLVFYDADGQLQYYQERGMFGQKRFKNPVGGRESYIYFTRPEPKRVVLVESAVSAIRLHGLGFESGAFLGKPTAGQLEALRRSGLREVAVMLDADALGASVDLVRRLCSAVPTRLIALPWGDPCNLSDKLLLRRLASWK